MIFRSRAFLLAALLALAAPLGACGTLGTVAQAPGGPQVQQLPPSPQAKIFGEYLSAHHAASQHDLDDAAAFYRQALAGDPDNEDILSRAFLFTAASGDVQAAAPLAAKIVARSPDDRTARLVLAIDDMQRDDYAGARMQIAQSARGPFTSLTLTLLDAWAAQGQGNTDQAIKDLAQVTDQGGTEALARFHSAMILDIAGKPDEADKDYQAALLASGPTPREVEAYGRFLERQGRIADAKTFYAKFAAQPSLAPIVRQAEARMAAGQKPESLVQTPQQGAAEALFGIAASLTDETSADIAVLYLRMSLYLAPNLDLAKIVLADRFESLEKFSEAIAVYDSVSDASPFKTAAAIQAAVDMNRSGQTQAAIKALTVIANANPQSVTAWTALGDAWRDANRFDQAADAYDHAVKALGPVTEKDWPLFFARAVSEHETKNWPAAEADLKHALQLSPDQPEVLNYLGYSWVDRGENLPKALALLERARALSPTDGYIVDSVGWAYYKLGRYKDATAALQQAVELVPGDPTINAHYGDALWRVGRHLEAHFQWDHALAFSPDPTEKAALEKRLANGLPPEAPLLVAPIKR